MMMNQPMLIKNQPQPINNIKQSPSNHLNNHMNQQLNISPQNKSTPKTAQQKEQKVQKSRVYNNSKQNPNQGLTSQNLVQLIQNTHPMLQFNNSFHNANHHPMLNRSNVFTNSQFSHPMFGNQRVNGTFNNR